MSECQYLQSSNMIGFSPVLLLVLASAAANTDRALNRTNVVESIVHMMTRNISSEEQRHQMAVGCKNDICSGGLDLEDFDLKDDGTISVAGITSPCELKLPRDVALTCSQMARMLFLTAMASLVLSNPIIVSVIALVFMGLFL